METLQKLIENNPGLFRIIGPLLGLLIGYLIYLFIFGYEFRAFSPAMAVVGILSGIGLSNILEMLKSRYSKDKLIFVPGDRPKQSHLFCKFLKII